MAMRRKRSLSRITFQRRLRPVQGLAFIIVVFGLSVPSVESSQVTPPPRRIVLELTPTTTAVVRAVQFLAVRHRTRIGIEFVASNTRSARPRDSIGPSDHLTSPYGYDLTDMTIEDALQRISTLHVDGIKPLYAWSRLGSGYNIFPAGYDSNESVALSRRFGVEQFDLRSVRDALARVHQLYDPGFRTNPLEQGGHEPFRLRPLIERPLRLTIPSGTGRDILDAVADQYGGMLWMAQYGDPAGGYRNLNVSLVGFDGWTISARSRVE